MPTSENFSQTVRQVADICVKGNPLLQGAAAYEILHQPDIIRLKKVESQRFVKALLARSKAPSKRMKTALALHRESVTER
jgi:hypothetical protein